ncbi:DUF3800 domain-containing protein [Aquibium sp. A9E412]|uniref:DUF3800 domain-containing protein n=1 Tax=Aquibium sp. A9E412 TaxID=2976767 RepID=UPI0025AF9B0A|nr:DUF3800 domain-containing protein [Aquibium sp. A9E412]MDN2566422.1 DUF3800 domain-containing protein [Aquibium sp. A9E412]
MDSCSSDSEFIFYADESGDHSLTSVDPDYPVFSLSLCAFRKKIYCSRIVPRFQRLKFCYFGHDAVVLHEHDIRKQSKDFRILTDVRRRKAFLDDLATCLQASPFTIFSTVILKPDLKLDLFPVNPYAISLRICLQQAFRFLKRRRQSGKRTHFLFEKRGRREDFELELEFRRVVDGQNDLAVPFTGFDIRFVDKKNNSTGMQIADLTARPLGLSAFRRNQPNRALALIAPKLYRDPRASKPAPGIFVP